MRIDIVHGTMIETNNYFVGNDKEVVLIEASANVEDAKKVVGERNVLAILLTHGHWDHYLTLDQYEKEFKVKVYMTEKAYEKIKKDEKTFEFDRNPKINIGKEDICFIKDGDKLTFSNLEFTVIETKGHTDCSVSYLLKNVDADGNDLLFSGDTLFNNGIGRDDLPTGSGEELGKSLKKLFELSGNTLVLPGHGDLTTIEQEANNFLLHRND